MQMRKRVSRLAVAAAAVIIGWGGFGLSPAQAQSPLVGLGETLDFTALGADGAQRVCRIKDFQIWEPINILGVDVLGCGSILSMWTALIPVPGSLPPRWIVTDADAASNTANAALRTELHTAALQVGIPAYAAGMVYNDFMVEDLHGLGRVVDAQFSVTFSLEGGMIGFHSYDERAVLTLEIEDITNPASPRGVGGTELFAYDRAGDSSYGVDLGVDLGLGLGVSIGGGESASLGASSFDRNNETAAYQLKLREGHTYRIWFKTEVGHAPIAYTKSEVSMSAWWTALSVTIDEEDFDPASLSDIRTDIQEIKRLLLLELADDDDDDDDDHEHRRKHEKDKDKDD